MFNRKYKKRKMKKIFQWREYLNWKKMNSTQKINFKRACLFPFLVYFVYVFLFKYSMAKVLIFRRFDELVKKADWYAEGY